MSRWRRRSGGRKRATTGPQDGEAGADQADVDSDGAPGGGVDVRVREVAQAS